MVEGLEGGKGVGRCQLFGGTTTRLLVGNLSLRTTRVEGYKEAGPPQTIKQIRNFLGGTLFVARLIAVPRNASSFLLTS